MKMRVITTNNVNYETNEGTREITAEEITKATEEDAMGNRTEFYVDRIINDTIYFKEKFYQGWY